MYITSSRKMVANKMQSQVFIRYQRHHEEKSNELSGCCADFCSLFLC